MFISVFVFFHFLLFSILRIYGYSLPLLVKIDARFFHGTDDFFYLSKDISYFSYFVSIGEL